MIKKTINIKIAPNTVPKTHIIQAVAKKYTLPKLYIAKDKNGKPSVAPGKNWHVYFYFRNPETNKLDSKSKFVLKYGINRYKTAAERKAFAKNLIEVYTDLLQAGYNPYTKSKPDTVIIANESLTTKEALNQALDQKRKILTKSTISDWEYRLKSFLQFADRQGFLNSPVKEVTTRHIVSFLNYLENKKELGSKSINNFRACLSTLFTKLANDMIIDNNPVTIVHKRKVSPVKNKPFTPKEVEKIKKYFLEHDPGMLHYLKFVAYAFLRPVEICRIKVNDVHLDNNFLTVKTKTESIATVLMIPQLKESLNKKQIEAAGQDHYLISRNFKPGAWDAEEKTKTKFFSDRFATMKNDLKFGKEYGIYSLRHTFAVDLFNSFIKKGLTTVEAEMKMLPITRHKSLSGLRNYLRDVGAMMPKDYGGDYTIDF